MLSIHQYHANKQKKNRKAKARQQKARGKHRPVQQVNNNPFGFPPTRRGILAHALMAAWLEGKMK